MHMQMIDENGIYPIVESGCVVNILWISYTGICLTDFDRFWKYCKLGGQGIPFRPFFVNEKTTLILKIVRKWSRPQQIIFGEVYNKTLWSMKKCYNHINVTTFRSGRWCISRFIEEIHLYMWTFRGCFVAVVQSATLLWNCNSKIHSNPNLLNQILTFFIYSYNVNNFSCFQNNYAILSSCLGWTY